MLERAKGCLEHNGQRLLRLQSRTVKSQRLHHTFWTHGAEEIEIPGWWADLLLRPAREEKEKSRLIQETARQFLKAGFRCGPFLDFLYPRGARDLVRQIAGRRNDASCISDQARSGSLRHQRAYSRSAVPAQDAHNQRGASEGDIGSLVASIADMDQPGDLPSQRSERERIQESVYDEGPSNEWGGQPAPEIDQEGTFEARQESLYYHFREYQHIRREYNKTMQAIHALDAEAHSSLARREALNVAQRCSDAGEQLLRHAQTLILDHLFQNKGISNWEVKDFNVVLGIHLQQGTIGSPRFIRAFKEHISKGDVRSVMIQVVGSLLERGRERSNSRSEYHADSARKLYGIYTSWRSSAPKEIRDSTRPFWSYLPTGKRRPSLQHLLFTFRIMTNRYAKPRSGRDDTIGANSAAELAMTIISTGEYKTLTVHGAQYLFRRLTWVVQNASVDYHVARELLKEILYHHASGARRRHAVLHAFNVFTAMDRCGSYRGEINPGTPDLARRLYFDLVHSGFLQQAEKVFENIRSRKVDHIEDFEPLLRALARRGDKPAFEKLEAARIQAEMRLASTQPEIQARFGKPEMSTYKDKLELHRRRNELDAMLTIFDEIQNDPRLQVDRHVYNQIISCHARRGDLKGADSFFQRMTAAGFTPDIHSYISTLYALARRGDIETIRDLTEEIDRAGIAINDWVINTHVYALIQRGHLNEAERLIFRALTFRLEDRTKMWNYVLLAWALRGDRVRVNWLMLVMKQNGIPYDAFTYSCRMQMWIMRGRPRKAYTILQTAMPKLGLRPVALHYALAIQGFTSGKYNGPRLLSMVRRVYEHMLRHGIEPDWSVKAALSRAIARAGELKTPRQALSYLQSVLVTSEKRDVVAGPLVGAKNLGDQYEVFTTGMFEFIFSLSRLKNFRASFDKIWDVYLDYIRRTSEKPFNPPLRILTRIMAVFRKQGAYDEVRKCWDDIVKKAEDLGHSGTGSVLYARRHLLAGPLHSYMTSLFEQRAPVQVAKTAIADTLRRGFELDNRCWNLYIRMLLLSGPQYHLLAFETAEEQVMFEMRSGWPEIRRGILYIQAKKTEELMPEEPLRRRRQFSTPSIPFRLESSIGAGLDRLSENRDFRVGPHDWRSLPLSPAVDERTGRNLSTAPTEAEQPKAPAIDLQAIDEVGRQAGTARQTLLNTTLTETGDRPSFALPGQEGHRDTSAVFVQAPGFLKEGGFFRRPEYSTLVYLAGAYIQFRTRHIFDEEGKALLDELHAKTPKLMAMIMNMPRFDDKLQKEVLRA